MGESQNIMLCEWSITQKTNFVWFHLWYNPGPGKTLFSGPRKSKYKSVGRDGEERRGKDMRELSPAKVMVYILLVFWVI